MPLLHPWPSSSLPLLASHLVPHLPISLASYNTLLLPNPTVSFYATFPPTSEPPEVWVLLADFGNQVRPFCSVEGGVEAGEKQKEGERLLLGALAEWFRSLPAERDGPISIGAVHERWIPVLRRRLNPSSVGEYRTHLAPLEDSEKAEERARELPEGMSVGEARPEDIDEILSTSEVAHPPSYLLSRLPFSTALFLTSSSSSSSSPILLASCFTHRDGCLGTLHVSPSHRRQGLARTIIEAREKKLQEQGGAGVRGFAHVGRGNEESRGLMKVMGWEEGWGVAWVRCERAVWADIE